MGVNYKKEVKLPPTPGRSLHSAIPLHLIPPVERAFLIRRETSDVPQTEVPAASTVPNFFLGNNGALLSQEQIFDHTLNFLQTENRRLRALRQQVLSSRESFDPEKYDPTNESFKDTCDKLNLCDLDKHAKIVRDTILKYSLCIRRFPDCPDEDLMLAVYFYFEEKFKVKAKFELCVRFDNHNEKNLVGVIVDSIKTRDEILEKVNSSKRTKIKITCNAAFHWILDGFCGP